MPLGGKISIMEQTLTLVVKLEPTPEQSAKLDKTLKRFANACNYINDNTPESLTNKIAIQSLTYQTVKADYGLVANMAVRAAARVAANRKAAKVKGRQVKQFNPTSMDLDKDLFRFIEKNWTVSLATVEGREKVALNAGNYQRGKLSGRSPKSAVLCKHGDGAYYLHIAITSNVPDPGNPGNVIGVDFGRRDIAVTSEGESWDGKEIQDVRDRFSFLRRKPHAIFVPKLAWDG